MRHIFISVFLISAFLISHAQEMTTPMLNYSSLEKQLAKSDEDIKDPKQSVKAKTWFTRAELFQDINDVNIEFLRFGMPTSEVQLFHGGASTSCASDRTCTPRPLKVEAIVQ